MKISRREFLRRGAGAALGAATITTLVAKLPAAEVTDTDGLMARLVSNGRPVSTEQAIHFTDRSGWFTTSSDGFIENVNELTWNEFDGSAVDSIEVLKDGKTAFVAPLTVRRNDLDETVDTLTVPPGAFTIGLGL